MKVSIDSKLPDDVTSIFAVMAKVCADANAINLGQGFPNFDCSDVLKEKIEHYLRAGKNQYCAMPGLYELRKVLADKANLAYGSDVNPNTEITITAGATQAISNIITSFVKPQDEVIIIEPAYDCYKPSIEICGGTVVPYVLKAPEFLVDWDAFKELISERTKLIVINTPHNPIGKTFKQHDMKALQDIVADKNIIVLSDEVYEHLVYDKQVHQSVLRFPKLYEQCVAVYSFGKTFHSTGWKLGYAIAPEYITKEIRKVHQWNVFSVNSFLQYALADYMQDPEPYLGLGDFYQQKRDFFNLVMQDCRLKPISCEGTYFQLFDYSELSQERDLDMAKRLAREYGVASIPVSPFYGDRSDGKVLRFCFAKTENVLSQAAEKLSKL